MKKSFSTLEYVFNFFDTVKIIIKDFSSISDFTSILLQKGYEMITW